MLVCMSSVNMWILFVCYETGWILEEIEKYNCYSCMGNRAPVHECDYALLSYQYVVNYTNRLHALLISDYSCMILESRTTTVVHHVIYANVRSVVDIIFGLPNWGLLLLLICKNIRLWMWACKYMYQASDFWWAVPIVSKIVRPTILYCVVLEVW